METQPMFQWNGTPLVIPCEPSIAEAYNRRCDQFLEAQVKFLEKNGRPWNSDKRISEDGHIYSEPLPMKRDDEAQKAYELVGAVINALVALCNGGIAFPEEMVDDTGLVRIN